MSSDRSRRIVDAVDATERKSRNERARHLTARSGTGSRYRPSLALARLGAENVRTRKHLNYEDLSSMADFDTMTPREYCGTARRPRGSRITLGGIFFSSSNICTATTAGERAVRELLPVLRG